MNLVLDRLNELRRKVNNLPNTNRREHLKVHLPSILLMFELCMSGQAFRILRRSSRAHTMKAFIGRFTWGGWVSSRDLARIILAPNILPESTHQHSGQKWVNINTIVSVNF